MTPAQVDEFVNDMITSGRFRTQGDIAKCLGISRQYLIKIKRRGADRKMSLAILQISSGQDIDFTKLKPVPVRRDYLKMPGDQKSDNLIGRAATPEEAAAFRKRVRDREMGRTSHARAAE